MSHLYHHRHLDQSYIPPLPIYLYHIISSVLYINLKTAQIIVNFNGYSVVGTTTIHVIRTLCVYAWVYQWQVDRWWNEWNRFTPVEHMYVSLSGSNKHGPHINRSHGFLNGSLVANTHTHMPYPCHSSPKFAWFSIMIKPKKKSQGKNHSSFNSGFQ